MPDNWPRIKPVEDGDEPLPELIRKRPSYAQKCPYCAHIADSMDSVSATESELRDHIHRDHQGNGNIDTMWHNEFTLFKVKAALNRLGLRERSVTDIINAIHNEGVYFRENVPNKE